MSRHPARTGEKTFFGHPFQLSTLFHIELWERFSFYGMQGILLIYLLLHRRQRRLGHRQNPRRRHCRRIQRQRVPVHHFGRVVCRPRMGCGKNPFLSGIVVMLGHIVLAAAPCMAF